VTEVGDQGAEKAEASRWAYLWLFESVDIGCSLTIGKQQRSLLERSGMARAVVGGAGELG